MIEWQAFEVRNPSRRSDKSRWLGETVAVKARGEWREGKRVTLFNKLVVIPLNFKSQHQQPRDKTPRRLIWTVKWYFETYSTFLVVSPCFFLGLSFKAHEKQECEETTEGIYLGDDISSINKTCDWSRVKRMRNWQKLEIWFKHLRLRAEWARDLFSSD